MSIEVMCQIADALVHHSLSIHVGGFDEGCTECARLLREINETLTRGYRHTFRNKWFSRDCKICRQSLADPMHGPTP